MLFDVHASRRPIPVDRIEAHFARSSKANSTLLNSAVFENANSAPQASERVIPPVSLTRPKFAFVDEGKLFWLGLGKNKDELKTVLVGDLEVGGRPMSDIWGTASKWAEQEFAFDPATVDFCKLGGEAHAWDSGHYVDLQRCREMGFSERWLNVLRGVDLMMDRVPMFDVSRENYKSAILEKDILEKMLLELAETGVLESPFDGLRVLNSLGVVVKKLEPGQLGPAKRRPVVDCKASGVNDCIRDCPFDMLSINDVVRSTYQGWWAAKFDLKDWFLPHTSRSLYSAIPRG